jgi:hypothetical protein
MTAKFNYDDFAAIALDLIEASGVQVLWQKPALPLDGADPWRDERDGIAESFSPTIAFFSPLDLARGRGQFAMFNNGTDIITYTEVGLLAGSCGFEPDVTDTLIRSGNVLQIVQIDRIQPADIPVLYYVAVK